MALGVLLRGSRLGTCMTASIAAEHVYRRRTPDDVNTFLHPSYSSSNPIRYLHPSPTISRHLLRAVTAARAGESLSASLSYLRDTQPASTHPPVLQTGAALRRSETQLWLLQHRARAAVLEAEATVATKARSGIRETGGNGGVMDPKEAMVLAGVDLGR